MHWKVKNRHRKYDDLIPEIDKRMRKGAKPVNLAVEFKIPLATLYRKIEEYRADEWIKDVRR